MVILLEPQPRRANLLLHCGAHAADREIIGAIRTPEPTATWTPLPHMALIKEVEQVLSSNGLSVVNQAHSLTHDGLRHFGLMEIQNGVIHRDYAWVLGLRNSHDKSFPAGIVAGANVFVCDNLSFSGEIKIARKHTRFILRDLPFLTQRAIGRFMERWHHQDQRINAYKGKNVSDSSAHDLIIRSTDVRACTPRQIPAILREWCNPRHEEFQARTLWTLFNSIASHGKLFFVGILCHFITLVLDVIIAWALYVLLAPVNQALSLLTAFFRLVYAANYLSGLSTMLTALRMINLPYYRTIFGDQQLDAQVQLLISSFHSSMGLAIFGIDLILLGYLIFRSGYIPWILGVIRVVVGVGWIVNSLRPYLFPHAPLGFVPIMGVGELLLPLWLLIRGWEIRRTSP